MRKLIYAINLTINGSVDHSSDTLDNELLLFSRTSPEMPDCLYMDA
jgi:hypothetical protein